jgi:hypothetical protein
MKTFISILAIGLCGMIAHAQTIKEADVPAPVKEAQKKQYPATRVKKWEKEGLNYEAEMHLNKVETTVVYDPSGKLIETEIEIAVSELPPAVLASIAKQFTGKKTKEASKITNALGNVSYEAEIGDREYFFNANGDSLKQQ